MRKAIFEVPTEVMAAFVEKLSEQGHDNTITGVNEYDEIEIEVMYEKPDEDQIDELELHLQDLIDDQENKQQK